MKRTTSFYDLRDALQESGCAICRLKAQAVERYVTGLLWELVNDSATREKVRRARGFCQEHTGALKRRGASLDVAILMRDVLDNATRSLQGARWSAPTRTIWQRLRATFFGASPMRAPEGLVPGLIPTDECPICIQVREVEIACCDALAGHLLADNGLLTAFRESDGFCLPHARLALSRARNASAFDALAEAQRAIWGRLTAELSEIIRRNDYRFQDEVRGEEADAWLRALALVAGTR